MINVEELLGVSSRMGPRMYYGIVALISISFSALFLSYILGSLPKINAFEKRLVSRSVLPRKARQRPMGLVSVS